MVFLLWLLGLSSTPLHVMLPVFAFVLLHELEIQLWIEIPCIWTQLLGDLLLNEAWSGCPVEKLQRWPTYIHLLNTGIPPRPILAH